MLTKMKSIEISNYKTFRHLKINDLGAVNLIVGKNNAGKSTLLEAISILASGGNINWIRNLLELRGMTSRYPYDAENIITNEQSNFCTLYHGRDCELFKSHPIRIFSPDFYVQKTLFKELDAASVEIRLTDVVDIAVTDENGITVHKKVPKETIGNDTIIDGDLQPAIQVTVNETKTIHLFRRQPRRNLNIDKKFPFEYVKTADFTGDKNPDLFDRIALTHLEPTLISALQIIDDRIEAINFLKDTALPNRMDDDNRVAYVVLKGNKERVRLSTMGDGINRVLTIILALLNSRGGILLIDEFENGLHYSVQENVWRLINHLALKLNIQVFATTHSNDCIKSFLKATENTDQSRIIRLEKRASGEIAVMYGDSDELDMIANSDIEIR